MQQEPNIPENRRELWEKLQAFVLDVPGHEYNFSKRLAKRMKWDHAFALRVVEEYRKFLFLTNDHFVTPSIHVDEAWHLHMIYTVSYWEGLCINIFGKPLHHHPGTGSNEDSEKFAAIYERTLWLYEQHFGTPPIDIWGKPNPGIDWRAIWASLPVNPKTKSRVLDLFRPRPYDEAP